MKRVSMNCTILLVVFLSFSLHSIGGPGLAGSNQITVSSAKIAVKRADGRDWDMGPGGPDPFVKIFVGGSLALRTEVKKDTYVPSWGEAVNVLYREGVSFRIEVWDRDGTDGKEDDLIGKWEATGLPGEVLSFGQVSVLNLSVR